MPVLFLYGEAHPLVGSGATDQSKRARLQLLRNKSASPLWSGRRKANHFLCTAISQRASISSFCRTIRSFSPGCVIRCSAFALHYLFGRTIVGNRRLSPEAKPLFQRVVAGECSLVEFGCDPLVAQYYRGMLGPLGLDGLALSAVVEHPAISFGNCPTPRR